MISYSDKPNNIYGHAYTKDGKIGFKGTIEGKQVDVSAKSAEALLEELRCA